MHLLESGGRGLLEGAFIGGAMTGFDTRGVFAGAATYGALKTFDQLFFYQKRKERELSNLFGEMYFSKGLPVSRSQMEGFATNATNQANESIECTMENKTFDRSMIPAIIIEKAARKLNQYPDREWHPDEEAVRGAGHTGVLDGLQNGINGAIAGYTAGFVSTSIVGVPPLAGMAISGAFSVGDHLLGISDRHKLGKIVRKMCQYRELDKAKQKEYVQQSHDWYAHARRSGNKYWSKNPSGFAILKVFGGIEQEERATQENHAPGMAYDL